MKKKKRTASKCYYKGQNLCNFLWEFAIRFSYKNTILAFFLTLLLFKEVPPHISDF